jgi:hypothetical protein
LTDVYKVDIRPSYVFERINLVIFMNSKDNSFIYANEFTKVLERISDTFENFVKSEESFKIVMSTFLLLLTSDQMLKTNINWTNICFNYTNNPALHSANNEILFIQFLAHVPNTILENNYSMKFYFSTKFKEIKELESGKENLFELIFFQVLIKILVKGSYPFSTQLSDLEFATAILGMKNKIPINPFIVKIINCVLALCLMSNILSQPAVKYIKDKEIQNYLDIISIDYKEFISVK